MRLTEEEIKAAVRKTKMQYLGIWNGHDHLADAAAAGFREIERAVVEKWAKRLEGVVQNAMTGSYIAAEMRASLEEKE